MGSILFLEPLMSYYIKGYERGRRMAIEDFTEARKGIELKIEEKEEKEEKAKNSDSDLVKNLCRSRIGNLKLQLKGLNDGYNNSRSNEN